MAARRAAAAGEELESRHADALGQEMRRGSLPGHAAAHSALADVTAGGPYLDDTVEMLGKVEKQAQELAGSVDTMLSTLATKMGDIAQTSKQHSVMWAPPLRPPPRHSQPPSLLLPSRARRDALPVLALTRASARRFDNLVSGTEHQAEFAVKTLPCPPLPSPPPDRPCRSPALLAVQITQMGCLISKCQHLDMELAPVDDMAAEIQVRSALRHSRRQCP